MLVQISFLFFNVLAAIIVNSVAATTAAFVAAVTPVYIDKVVVPSFFLALLSISLARVAARSLVDTKLALFLLNMELVFEEIQIFSEQIDLLRAMG